MEKQPEYMSWDKAMKKATAVTVNVTINRSFSNLYCIIFTEAD